MFKAIIQLSNFKFPSYEGLENKKIWPTIQFLVLSSHIWQQPYQQVPKNRKKQKQLSGIYIYNHWEYYANWAKKKDRHALKQTGQVWNGNKSGSEGQRGRKITHCDIQLFANRFIDCIQKEAMF